MAFPLYPCNVVSDSSVCVTELLTTFSLITWALETPLAALSTLVTSTSRADRVVRHLGSGCDLPWGVLLRTCQTHMDQRCGTAARFAALSAEATCIKGLSKLSVFKSDLGNFTVGRAAASIPYFSEYGKSFIHDLLHASPESGAVLQE